MKKINDFDQVQEVQDYAKLEAGPYISQIVSVVDVPEKEYLIVNFDIADGTFKNHFKDMKERMGLNDWPIAGSTIKSYKQTALPWFKRFIVAVEKSNTGFKFDFDEQKLVGKYFVANLGEEEYDNGVEIKTSLRMQEARSIPSYKEGNVEVPKPKKVSDEVRSKYSNNGVIDNNTVVKVDDEDLPF